MKKKPIAASVLAKKAKQDNTKYLAREVGEAICHDIDKQLRECIEKHKNIIMEDEFCLVRVIATDNLIHGLKRIKYYAWPYLPSPRPNQAVFLYNKPLDKITKRLWVLPNAFTMAELCEKPVVPKEYETMQAWSIAFHNGTFWDYIRHDQQIDMLSEREYISKHREELIKAGCQPLNTRTTEAFDFTKVELKEVVDTQEAMVN